MGAGTDRAQGCGQGRKVQREGASYMLILQQKQWGAVVDEESPLWMNGGLRVLHRRQESA